MRTATLSLILLPLLACAQNWCPPGAEWLFGFYSQQANGVRHAWYSGDTVVGGIPARRIDQFVNAYQPIPPFGTPYSFAGQPLFFAEVGDAVMLWNSGTSTYDTVMWFGAVPGDHWDAPDFTGLIRFDVLDTGTTDVSGISLRYLVVEEPMVMGSTDTLLERIGFNFFYINPNETFVLDFTTMWLQCYRDSAISQFDGNVQMFACDFSTGLAEERSVPFRIAPNPGSDHLVLELPRPTPMVEVLDVTGRPMIQVPGPSGSIELNTSTWPAGVYFVRLAGLGAVQRWVKQ